ncbi:hypothetical protein K9M74_01600 [Candidatus Woesearchaeota archaeon]|nr:hypothetical protein [Candidatus Woesearchaeota archaeon]
MRLEMSAKMRPEIKIIQEEVFREIENRFKKKNIFSQPNKESIEEKLQFTGKQVNYKLKRFKADIPDYVAQVMMLQFLHPLLQLNLREVETEFKKIMKNKYEVHRPRIGIYFVEQNVINQSDFIEESMSLDILSKRLANKEETTYNIKNSDLTKKNLEIAAANAMNAYETNKLSLKLLAESFGRVKVIPLFYAYKNNKHLQRYNSITNTTGIKYIMPIPNNLT